MFTNYLRRIRKKRNGGTAAGSGETQKGQANRAKSLFTNSLEGLQGTGRRKPSAQAEEGLELRRAVPVNRCLPIGYSGKPEEYETSQENRSASR